MRGLCAAFTVGITLFLTACSGPAPGPDRVDSVAATSTREPSAGGTADRPVVEARSGRVRGITDQGAEEFLGIPFARPPVGSLRWRPPQPAEPWTGVRDAAEYGNRCPAKASVNGPESLTEDCLFVNVHRPEGTRASEKLPVFVFIHGGSLREGSSNQYDGAELARSAGIVVVTLNYRLGPFGFLADPALTAEQGESGNYGLQDQQAALRWVRGNVTAFGGDPEQLTIGGESAGAISVCAHLSAPASRDLFQAAIIQSGGCLSRTQAQAEEAGRGAVFGLGCLDRATVLSCLREAPVSRVLDAAALSAPGFVRGTPTLPGDPFGAVKTGDFARVPVLIGSNTDEARTFTQGVIGWSQFQYELAVRALSGDAADAILKRYPWPKPEDENKFTAAHLLAAIFTDAGPFLGIGGCATGTLTREFSQYAPTFAYEFAHREGPSLAKEPEGYDGGASHANELPYLWPSFTNGTPLRPQFEAPEQQLADTMVDYWGAFVRTQDPEGSRAAWPEVTTSETGPVLKLRSPQTPQLLDDTTFDKAHRCDLWNTVSWPPTGLNQWVLGFLGVSGMHLLDPYGG
jgi:carboxylesterase type B